MAFIVRHPSFFNGETFDDIARGLAGVLFRDLPASRLKQLTFAVAIYVAGVLISRTFPSFVPKPEVAKGLGKANRITDAKVLSRFRRRNGGIDGEAVEVIEVFRIRPGGCLLFPKIHERALEVRNGLHAAVGIAGRHDASLAGIVAMERDFADAKGPARAGRAKKPVLPKRLDAFDFEIAAESPPCAFQGQFGKPVDHASQAGLAANRGAEGFAVVGETVAAFAGQLHGKAEKVAQPAVEWRRFAEHELLSRCISIRPKGRLLKIRTEGDAKEIHPAGAFAVHIGSRPIDDGMDAVML
ncbi:MAG: hypothetical protein PHC88_14870 [Terrimicrobiaceae bacterium]|nr:hypothetical protein [Terrimicrobiaceae bacterium]